MIRVDVLFVKKTGTLNLDSKFILRLSEFLTIKFPSLANVDPKSVVAH